jgi:hypothetical protein
MKLLKRFWVEAVLVLMVLAIFALAFGCASPKLRVENTALKVELAYLKGFMAGASAAEQASDAGAHSRPSLMVQR